MTDKLIIFDTTLRDGEQSPGASMTREEKVRIAKALERLRVDVIEAGFPAASPGDFEGVQAVARTIKESVVCGLARALDKDIDRAGEALRDAPQSRIHTFIATSPIHMQLKLRMSPEQVIEHAVKAVKRARQYTDNVEFSPEDAGRSEEDFLCRILEAVIDAGATTLNIPDTVGYSLPHQFGQTILRLRERIPNADKAIFSVHCHNDLGLAVANSLSAVLNGARQVECTINGLGERAGNAALEEVVMAITTRKDVFPCYVDIDTREIVTCSKLVSSITGFPVQPNKAIVGANAFAHESGIHQDGMLKNRETYEIMTPQSIGRKSTDLVIGKHSGRNAVRTRLEELGYRLDDEQVNVVFAAVKDLADKKANVHDEDLEALVFSEVYRLPDRYRLGNVSVQTTMGSSMPATAAVVIQAGEEEMRRAGFGAGPIDATFNVISQIVSRAPDLEQFSINAITGGTDAQGEVTVRLREGEYSATGRGSDPDIIVASAKAYIDALNRLDHKERDALRTQEATGEPAINTCN